ncbi:helix-turn-helix domain-containing protein [Rhodoligotrophos ferricapiens]|uniref:AraC-like ligand-binding domain-containing protein n=1 Tax=Rhodoligotrophos ferricapiens TaxID=3069264 RepID=UPI00315D3FD1
MDARYSTKNADPADRKRYWNEAVSSTYFPLDLTFKNEPQFGGSLHSWTLGSLSMSRLESDGLLYRRHKRHLLHERDESYLITVPELSEVHFIQDGREARCKPGQFLVERSHLPYEFSYGEPNTLWVLKIPSEILRSRIVMPERLASLGFDATQGTGALFVDVLRLVAARLAEMDESARAMSGKHLVDLLSMAISADERTLNPNASSVQMAHLHRVETFIRLNLASSALNPHAIAAACGISVRYLHQLFSSQGRSVSEWVKLQRLLMCKQMLSDPTCHKKVSEIAYEWGFSDQAQFSRLYRAEFGVTPSDTREQLRMKRAEAAPG